MDRFHLETSVIRFLLSVFYRLRASFCTRCTNKIQRQNYSQKKFYPINIWFESSGSVGQSKSPVSILKLKITQSACTTLEYMLFCRVCEDCLNLKIQLLRAENKIEALTRGNAEKTKQINDLQKQLIEEKNRHALLQAKINTPNVNIVLIPHCMVIRW